MEKRKKKFVGGRFIALAVSLIISMAVAFEHDTSLVGATMQIAYRIV